MMTIGKLTALAVACFPLHSIALGARRSEVPADIMERAMAAIGIRPNISDVRSVRISGSQFRTRSMITSISLDSMDQTVVPYGSQNITYSYEEGGLKQRIDKLVGLGTLWVFSRPKLEPMDYSVIVQDGDQGFAAVTRGSFSLFEPTAAPEGFLDGYLAAYMISDGHKWDPLLVNAIQTRNNFTLSYEPVEGGILLPAVFDRTLNMSVLFNIDSYLPFAIRTYEDHPFFGPSTNDLRVYDYTSVHGLTMPRRFKVMYNNERLVTDFIADEISVNVALNATFFDVPNRRQELHVPIVDAALTAEIGEKYANYLWFGRFNWTIADFDARQPYLDMPGVWVLRLPNIADYRQILLETDTYVVVLDAPSEQVAILLEWVRIYIGKPVTQAWPTHHHHDHAFGVKSYVEMGAEIVVPEMAIPYYSNIPGIKFATYQRGAPFVVQSSTFRATFIHIEGSMHAQDHSVAVIMPLCPTNESSVVVFDADHVIQASLFATHNDHAEVNELVAAMVKHRVAKSAFLVPVHGALGNMSDIYDGMGFLFPDYTPLDFEYRGKNCENLADMI